MNKPISIEPLKKAQKVFEEYRTDMKDNRDKTGAVQAFEFCYELSWKSIKRILELQGLEVESPKNTFRKAALVGFIDDVELWFKFQEMRNLTVHTYNEENLEEVIAIFDVFSIELQKLVEALQKALNE